MANLTLQRTGLSSETGDLESRVVDHEEKMAAEEAKLKNILEQSQSLQDIFKDTGGSAETLAANMEAEIKEHVDAIADVSPKVGEKTDELATDEKRDATMQEEITEKKAQTEKNAKFAEGQDKKIDDLVSEAKARANKIEAKTKFIEKTKAAIGSKKEETERMVAASSEFNEGHKGGAKKPQPYHEVVKKVPMDKDMPKPKAAKAGDAPVEESTAKEERKPMTREERAKMAEEKAKNRSKAAAAAKAKKAGNKGGTF